jgi:Bacteriocin-protection, YdeI or OmpD-Associated/Domain of unknown function (DUF1905)
MPASRVKRFSAVLESAGRGGHVIALDDDVVRALDLRAHTRVRGAIEGAPYRSSTARYGGRMYLGVHKATVERAGVSVGDTVRVVLELDGPPTIEVPPELEAALAADPRARRGWDAVPGGRRRELAASVADAKRPETRARRVAAAVEALHERAGR